MGSPADFRARLQPKTLRTGNTTINGVQYATNDVLGPNEPSNILYPLWSTGGVLFPYTPSVSSGSVVEYEPSGFIHSNYGYNAYIRSYPKSISITSTFTAQTTDEALYLLAVFWFFRSTTKSYFGVNPYNKAGTPPPVLVFNYLGDYQYRNVPVVIKTFDYTLPGDVDYVPINTGAATGNNYNLNSNGVGTQLSGFTYVPVQLTTNIELDVQYIPIKLRNEFNLDLFRQGKLINGGYI
jgi:hypothetical protein